METTLTSPFHLLKKAWSLALSRPNILSYVILGIVPQLISLLIGFIASLSNMETSVVDLVYSINGWGVAGLIVVGIIIVSLVSTWYAAVLYLVYKATASGTVSPLVTYFRPAKNVTVGLLVTYLRIGFITLLGFLLFIIPGIIIAVRYMFAPMIAVVEDRTAKPIDESKRLVKGRFFKLIGRGILLVICYNIPVYIFTTLSTFTTLHPLFGSVWAVTSPIFGLYFYLVYLDFKKTLATAS